MQEGQEAVENKGTETEQTSVEATGTAEVQGKEATAKADPATPASTEAQAAAAVKAAVAAYQPNLKYKFLDQEKEFHPALKDLVKTPELEKILKEFHEKADGLDFIKPKYQSTRDELKSVRAEYATMQQQVQNLGKMIQQGDLDSFFEGIQLNPRKVYDWVLQKVQEQEMPAEQRQIYAQAREQKRRAAQLEEQLQAKEQLVQQTAAQARATELEFGLNSPDVKPFADAFDAQAGKPGSFKRLVAQQGLLAFHETGTDISVEEAIKRTMETYGKFVKPHAGATQADPGLVQTQAANPQLVQPKPVIPNVQGKGSSPASRKVTSIAQLKELAAQMAE